MPENASRVQSFRVGIKFNPGAPFLIDDPVGHYLRESRTAWENSTLSKMVSLPFKVAS